MIEQSQADKLLKLEIAYSNLYQAYVSGDIDDMKNKYIAVGDVGIPNLESLVHNKTKQRMLSEGILPTKFPIPIYDIEDETLLRINTKGCLDALQDEINNLNIYQSNYIFAKNVLFQPNRNFNKEDIIYQNNEQQLKVADLLAVIKYAVNIAETIEPDNKNFTKANASIIILQEISSILNNKYEDRPINKMLHLATNFISSVVKSSVKEDQAKQKTTVTTLLVDLAIDFFCEK